MLVAVYGRVSTGRQENEQTIETQLMAVKDFIEKNGHTCVKFYKDEGWSGAVIARPGMDQLRLDASKSMWEGVVVYDPDRIARKYSYQTIILDELEEKGKQVLFVTTPPAETTEDRLLYGVKGLFAEYERAKTAERCRLGKLRKAREGNVFLTQAPYGYRYVPKQGNSEGYIEINKEESEAVQLMFESVGDGKKTIYQLIKKLQELGIKPRRSKRGVWSNSTLSTLLRNTTYIGKAFYNKSEGVVPENPMNKSKYRKQKKTSRKIRDESEWIEIPVPAIVSEELYYRVQNQLDANSKLARRCKRHEYLLAGLIRCTCGYTRTGEIGRYYRCSCRVNKMKFEDICEEGGVNSQVLDDLAWKEISTLFKSKRLIREHINKFVKSSQLNDTANEIKLKNLQKELENIRNEEERYAKAYGTGSLSLDVLEKVMKDVTSKKVAVTRQISNLEEVLEKTTVKLPSEKDIDVFVKFFQQKLRRLLFKDRRTILLSVVSLIEANQQKATIYGRLPFEEYHYVELQSNHRNCGSAECG